LHREAHLGRSEASQDDVLATRFISIRAKEALVPIKNKRAATPSTERDECWSEAIPGVWVFPRNEGIRRPERSEPEGVLGGIWFVDNV
jgi:hypothetical protein